MVAIFKKWYSKHFSDPEAVILLCTMLFLGIFVLNTVHLLASVYASIVIAYLLHGLVNALKQWHVSHLWAATLISVLATGLVFFTVVWCLPLAWQETSHFINELPNIMQELQTYLSYLTDRYGDFITTDQINQLTVVLKHEAAGFGKHVVSASVSMLPGVIELIVYAILVPLMVFFFLNDGQGMLAWMGRFFPKGSRLLHQVYDEVNMQSGRYVRGKFLELAIVFGVNAVFFKLLGLHYAILLAFFSGVSVLIPFVGVFLVSIPVVLVGYTQFGGSMTYLYLLLGYGLVMLLDGNVLVPLLFSETMAIHPVAIIIAVIFFGGIWGFWGVFFAIPLATVIKAMINAWPDRA